MRRTATLIPGVAATVLSVVAVQGTALAAPSATRQPAAGTYPVPIGYADSTTTDRPMDVAVDGAIPAADASSPATGGWNTWARKEFGVTPSAGTHTNRATATTAAGDLDHLGLDHLDLG